MSHEEPVAKFRSLEKVKILLRGTHRVVGYKGVCKSLADFDDKKDWHYVNFGEHLSTAIVIHDCQPESIIIESGRSGRKARLFFSQYVLYVQNGWTVSLPEYHLESASSVLHWFSYQSILDSLRELARIIKGK